MSVKNLPQIPTDPIFKLWEEFQKDPNPNKINLGIGIYQDDLGASYVMPSVQTAAKNIQTQNFDYVSMSGDMDFLENIGKKIFKEEVKISNIALQQTCGGTQAVEIWGKLMQKAGYSECIFPTPTWGNHFQLLSQFKHHKFNHLEKEDPCLENYKEALEKAPQKSLFVLQGGLTHNPCGKNLSQEQLQEIIPLIKQKEISVLVDFAYIGFGDGFEKDTQWLQYISKELDHISVAISFSKNACLYRHRLGTLMVKTTEKKKVESHLQFFIRESISNPPAFGAELINEILNNNFDQWLEELENMRISIDQRRQKLIDPMPQSWQHLKETKGMFGLLPLSIKQIEILKKEKGIYLLDNGRINFSSLQESKIDYVAQSILSVI